MSRRVVRASQTRSGSSGMSMLRTPVLPDRVWEALTYRRDVSGAPPIRQD